MPQRWPVPELEPHCGSWDVVHPFTGEVIAETFSRQNAEAYAARGYVVLTILQWLSAHNRALQMESIQ